MIHMWDNIVLKYAHLYGSQCNPLLHSAPTHYERFEPLFLGAPLSPDPLKDCPAHCHLRWLKRCLLGAQIKKTHSRFWIFIKYTGKLSLVPTGYWDKELDSITVSMETELSLCHWAVGDEATGALLWAIVTVYVDHSAGRCRRHLIGWVEKMCKMRYCPGKASIFLKYSTYMRWFWYTQTHPLAIDEIKHDEKRHAKQPMIQPRPVQMWKTKWTLNNWRKKSFSLLAGRNDLQGWE